MHKKMFHALTQNEVATRTLAQNIATCLRAGTIIALIGDLGAGKTCFAQALFQALGAKNVTSPTFNLMNVYKGTYKLHHFDLYRLQNEAALEEIGFYEYATDPQAVALIEWADKFPEALPEDYIRVEIAKTGVTERKFTLSLVGEDLQDVWERMAKLGDFSD